jgi:hypothetical protein
MSFSPDAGLQVRYPSREPVSRRTRGGMRKLDIAALRSAADGVAAS